MLYAFYIVKFLENGQQLVRETYKGVTGYQGGCSLPYMKPFMRQPPLGTTRQPLGGTIAISGDFPMTLYCYLDICLHQSECFPCHHWDLTSGGCNPLNLPHGNHKHGHSNRSVGLVLTHTDSHEQIESSMHQPHKGERVCHSVNGKYKSFLSIVTAL